jgi:hypothetical protein
MGQEEIFDDAINSMPINDPSLEKNEHPSWVRDDMDEDNIV